MLRLRFLNDLRGFLQLGTQLRRSFWVTRCAPGAAVQAGGACPSMVHDIISSPQEVPRVPVAPDGLDLPIAAARPQARGEVRQGNA
jgi:hypothetical protein